MKISFLVTGEGVCDLRLTEHIENILIAEGFTEVSGEAPDLSLFNPHPGRTVIEKMKALLSYYPNIDIIFVHRDADRIGVDARLVEIMTSAENLGIKDKTVAIVPVRALETWLLADLGLLKEVAGNRSDIKPQCLPPINRLEAVADPKTLLMDVLCELSGASGNKLKKFKGRFGEMRARLTFGLNENGPLKNIKSYADFRKSISAISVKIKTSSY